MTRPHVPKAICALLLVSGCGPYLGYRIESIEEVGREPRVFRRGKPKALRIDVRSGRDGDTTVIVEAKYTSNDWVGEVVVMAEKRAHGYACYIPYVDLVIEPFFWIWAAIWAPEPMIEGRWQELCTWPPVDLVARFCGSHGMHGLGGECPMYRDHPPCYPRRVAHWLVWVLPGYSLGSGARTQHELVKLECSGDPKRELREWPAARARVRLHVSTNGDRTLEAETDSEGQAAFDLSKHLERTGRRQSVPLRIRANYRGLTVEEHWRLDVAGSRIERLRRAGTEAVVW